MKASQAALAQAEANLEHQKADTTRTVALAKQGIASDQARDEAVTSLECGGGSGGVGARECRGRAGGSSAGACTRVAGTCFGANRGINARHCSKCEGAVGSGEC